MPQIGEIRNRKDVGQRAIGKVIWAACQVCGKERWVGLAKGGMAKGEPRSKKCIHCFPRWCEFSSKWKGGRHKRKDGYVFIKLPPDDFFHSMVKSDGYVLEHRLIVAKALGRCLLTWETVHHKEGFAKDDNRYPETLELLPSPYKHDALTRMVGYIRKLEREIERLKRQNEAEKNKPYIYEAKEAIAVRKETSQGTS